MKNLRITLIISFVALLIANISVAQSHKEIEKELKKQ